MKLIIDVLYKKKTTNDFKQLLDIFNYIVPDTNHVIIAHIYWKQLQDIQKYCISTIDLSSENRKVWPACVIISGTASASNRIWTPTYPFSFIFSGSQATCSFEKCNEHSRLFVVGTKTLCRPCLFSSQTEKKNLSPHRFLWRLLNPYAAQNTVKYACVTLLYNRIIGLFR
jgi:hypothetical protein